MDFTALTAARDKLNADIGTLVAAGSAPQATIDALTADVVSADTAVVAASTPPPALDFSKFDAAVTAFKADAKLNQNDIDVATGAIVAATV